MAEEPEWDDPRWRLTHNIWCRMWGPIPIDLIWGAFLTFVFGMYLLAALFLGIDRQDPVVVSDAGQRDFGAQVLGKRTSATWSA